MMEDRKRPHITIRGRTKPFRTSLPGMIYYALTSCVGQRTPLACVPYCLLHDVLHSKEEQLLKIMSMSGQQHVHVWRSGSSIVHEKVYSEKALLESG